MNSIAKDEVENSKTTKERNSLSMIICMKKVKCCTNSLDECDLRDPVREPADDVDGDDGQHELRHLAVGLPLAL